MNPEITISRRLAPEDILPGMFIAITARTHQVYPYWLLDGWNTQRVEPVAFSCMTCSDGDPRRVLAVCLPFVLTENSRGWTETLDVRLCAIVQVDEMFGLEVFTRPSPDVATCCD
ncbi:MAG: hypothetical protein KF678_02015 [Phycisphaeraceae bacterium]|nr:hypothetical protein [Phycisphaeraceae bacterium]